MEMERMGWIPGVHRKQKKILGDRLDVIHGVANSRIRLSD